MGKVLQFPNSARSLAGLIGRHGVWHTNNGLAVAIDVLDARRVYGRDELLVTPTHGDGSTWIAQDHIALDKIEEV